MSALLVKRPGVVGLGPGSEVSRIYLPECQQPPVESSAVARELAARIFVYTINDMALACFLSPVSGYNILDGWSYSSSSGPCCQLWHAASEPCQCPHVVVLPMILLTVACRVQASLVWMLVFDGLPLELQLSIARRLDSRSRLALGSTCQDCAPLVVHIAVLEFKVGKKAEAFDRCCEDWDGREGQITSLENVGLGESGVAKAFTGNRKKGHCTPLYDALASADRPPERIAGECHDGELDAWKFPWPAFTNCGAATCLVHAPLHRQLLSVGLDPSDGAINLSNAVLTCLPFGAAGQRALQLARAPLVSLKASLVALDLSRAHRLASIAASGLASLQKACLPAAARVVCFDGCGQLTQLHPTDGCAALQSLRMDGCRKLEGASFRAPHGWQLGRLEELDLCWCTKLDSATLAALLPAASNLRSLGVRGLSLSGVLEALEGASLGGLGAADFSFCSGLQSEGVRAFVTARGSLLRCNLRATTVSATVYNEVGQQCQARIGGASSSNVSEQNVVENRRRPKHLTPREAAPFFYLKR